MQTIRQWIQEEMKSQDRAFHRKRILQQMGFWLLVAAAIGAAAWSILR